MSYGAGGVWIVDETNVAVDTQHQNVAMDDCTSGVVDHVVVDRSNHVQCNDGTVFTEITTRSSSSSSSLPPPPIVVLHPTHRMLPNDSLAAYIVQWAQVSRLYGSNNFYSAGIHQWQSPYHTSTSTTATLPPHKSRMRKNGRSHCFGNAVSPSFFVVFRRLY